MNSSSARRARTLLPEGWGLSIKNLIFPQFCHTCHTRLLTEDNGYFCLPCWEGSPRIERPFCTFCGRPHACAVGYGTRSNFPCAECRESPPRHVRRIWGASIYEGAIAEAIKLLKFQGKRKLTGPLGELLIEFARAEMDQEPYDRIVPVPLHPVRQRSRGFNQSALLAREAHAAFPRAVFDESLKRIRPTRTQSRLTSEERHHSLRGAFAVIGDSMAGQRVLLIDDVVTTGGTVFECGHALRRAGATEVDVLAVALTVTGWDLT